MTGSPPERAAADRGLFRWHLSPTFVAHLFKAIFKWHHRELPLVLRALIPRDAVVLDVGAHAGQITELFAGLADRAWCWPSSPATASAYRISARAAKTSHNGPDRQGDGAPFISDKALPLAKGRFS